MNLIIAYWGGRLGNNICQLKHAIQIALYYNYNVIMPIHEYFTTDHIIINNTIDRDSHPVLYNKFYDINEIKNEIQNLNDDVFTQNIERTVDIIKSVFRIKSIPSEGHTDDLVIHIRGGDIFATPHFLYITPPLSYYTTIIETRKFDTITIVSEDKLNPCVDKLLELYPEIRFQPQSLDQDIHILLHASNVIESFGTFTFTLLLLSNNIQTVYRPSYQFNDAFYTNTLLDKIQTIDLEEYKNRISNWENTAEQRELMMTYQIPQKGI
jgi:hypothetical protein